MFNIHTIDPPRTVIITQRARVGFHEVDGKPIGLRPQGAPLSRRKSGFPLPVEDPNDLNGQSGGDTQVVERREGQARGAPVGAGGQDLVVGIEDRLSLIEYIIYGVQQLLVDGSAFIVPLVIAIGLNLPKGSQASIVQAALIGAGVVTLAQASRILKLPIMQATAAVMVPILITVGHAYGLGTAWTAMLIGGAVMALLAWPFRLWGWVRPLLAAPPVYGTMLTLLGLSLTSIIANQILGHPGTKTYGSGENFLLALIPFLVSFLLAVESGIVCK